MSTLLELPYKVICYSVSINDLLCLLTGAHRAFPDVIAMVAVMTHPSLVGCLTRILIRSSTRQMDLWTKQKEVFQRATALIKSLGKPSVTSAQAKRLDALGLGYGDLVKLRSESAGDEAFKKNLKDKGVNSKPLHDKLVKLLSGTHSVGVSQSAEPLPG